MWFMKPYFFWNFIIVLFYPCFRYVCNYKKNVYFYQSQAYERESSIFFGLLVITIIRYIRKLQYYSLQYIFYEVLFYLKLGILFLLFLYN